MLFKKTARPAAAPDPSAVSNDTPDTIDIRRIRSVVAASRWRSPGADRKRKADLERAILVLERTAACTDQAIERLNEVRASLIAGRAEETYLMRGLMTGRIEEILESLEPLSRMARHDGVNLLGPGNAALRVRLEAGDFAYTLAPICIHRTKAGLDIPFLHSAFEDDAETSRVIAAVERGLRRLHVFAERLSGDARVLIAMVQDIEARQAELDAEAQAREAASLALRASVGLDTASREAEEPETGETDTPALPLTTSDDDVLELSEQLDGAEDALELQHA